MANHWNETGRVGGSGMRGKIVVSHSPESGSGMRHTPGNNVRGGGSKLGQKHKGSHANAYVLQSEEEFFTGVYS